MSGFSFKTGPSKRGRPGQISYKDLRDVPERPRSEPPKFSFKEANLPVRGGFSFKYADEARDSPEPELQLPQHDEPVGADYLAAHPPQAMAPPDGNGKTSFLLTANTNRVYPGEMSLVQRERLRLAAENVMRGQTPGGYQALQDLFHNPSGAPIAWRGESPITYTTASEFGPNNGRLHNHTLIQVRYDRDVNNPNDTVHFNREAYQRALEAEFARLNVGVAGTFKIPYVNIRFIKTSQNSGYMYVHKTDGQPLTDDMKRMLGQLKLPYTPPPGSRAAKTAARSARNRK